MENINNDGPTRNLRPRKPAPIVSEENGKKKVKLGTDDPKPFTCETCGAKFEFKRNLSRHKPYHTKAREVGRCYFCDTKFTSLRELHEHLPHCTLRLQPSEPTKQSETKLIESQPCKPRSVVQEDVCSMGDPMFGLEDDLDFVLNENGDIEATPRTLEEMRQREIKFVENLWELLRLLLDGKSNDILDTQKPVAQNLEAVIEHCGHAPIRATGPYTSRLRENCKLLFKIAAGPKSNVGRLMETKPIEVVLEDVIKMGKESIRRAQEIIVLDSDDDSDIEIIEYAFTHSK